MWHYTSLRHSQPTSFSVSHSTSPDRTTLLAQHFWSSGLFCRWSDGLELATGQSAWPGAHQQQLQTIAGNEPISLLPLSTHSAVEMLHDSALYKSIIDIDIIDGIWLTGESADCRWHVVSTPLYSAWVCDKTSRYQRCTTEIFLGVDVSVHWWWLGERETTGVLHSWGTGMTSLLTWNMWLKLHEIVGLVNS